MEKKNSITDQKYQVSDRLKVELQELGWKNIGLDEEGHLIGNHDVHGNGMLINKFVKIHIDEQIKYSLKYDTMNENNKETTSNRDSFQYYLLIITLSLVVLSLILNMVLIFDGRVKLLSSIIQVISQVIILIFLGRNYPAIKANHRLNILRKKNEL